jgi:hypothetical protein
VFRGVVAAVLASLALAAPAGAWTKFATGVVNIVQPVTLRTSAATELVVWDDTKGSLFLLRNGTQTTLLSRLPYIGKPALVQQPNGLLQLYVPMQGNGLDGIARFTSSDDGATWAPPVQTKVTRITDVGSAAVAPDGTPYFTQSGTGFVNLYRGLDGDSTQNLFATCCGYAESVAVTSGGSPVVAFWSNATSAADRYVVADTTKTLFTRGTQTAPRDDRVPLLTDSGQTWLMWSDGYPTATALYLDKFTAGETIELDHGSFNGGDPHMALVAEPDGSLWALWTKNGVVDAARSRTTALSPTTFGATVTVKVPPGTTAYQLEALARPGSVDAFLNTGDSLWRQKLLPGLTVHATRKVATVLDDGFPVKGAHVGSKTTDAKGRASIAKLKRHTLVRVTASGYTPAAFRVP